MYALLFISTLLIANPADVRISNAHLQITCLDGKLVAAGQRKWKLPEHPVSMTLTMRNEPRAGQRSADAGFAAITFTPQDGHTYEVEVRSDPLRYSSRVWPKGEWRPVVRDRTTDRIVSSEPQWLAAPECGTGVAR